MSKYIEFVLVEQKPKIGVWKIISKNHGDVLGIVKWHGPWRQYCFFPEGKTLYSRGCLIDVVSFIEKLMEERKVRRSR